MKTDRNELLAIRESPAEAGDLIFELLEEKYLASVLEAVAQSVEIAHETAPAKWGLRLNYDSVMLKIGFLEVLTFSDNWFHQVAFGNLIPDIS